MTEQRRKAQDNQDDGGDRPGPRIVGSQPMRRGLNPCLDITSVGFEKTEQYNTDDDEGRDPGAVSKRDDWRGIWGSILRTSRASSCLCRLDFAERRGWRYRTKAYDLNSEQLPEVRTHNY